MNDKLNLREAAGVAIVRGPGNIVDELKLKGRYEVECFGADDKLKWREVIDNVVTALGKNLLLDSALAGSAYTVTGPYMGLISSVSWSAVNGADTQASHAGWLEAGSTNAPTFAARIIAAWSAASAGVKSLSSALSFTMTGSGTLEGCFMVYGTGAVATLMDTGGVLLSAGAFTGGSRAVLSGDTVNVSYSLSV